MWDVWSLLLASLGAACCLVLTRFFFRAWCEPTMRALTIFFGVSGLAYVWLMVINLVQLSSDVPARVFWESWRPIVYRSTTVVALLYLAWTLHRNGRGAH